MEKISILMPAYNASLYVELSINAILNQSHENFELLVCDDCSTDNTFEIIKSISDTRVKVFQNNENKGYLQTCNELAELAQGQYITFQDADDLANKNRLSLLLSSLKERKLDLIGSNVNYVTEHGNIIGRSFYPVHVDTNYLLNETMPFCGSSILCTKEVYQQIGLYDVAFDRMGAEDFDWVYRAIMQFKAGNLEEPLYSYRMHAASISNVTSLTLSTQLFSENIAKALFIARINKTLLVDTSTFITNQHNAWKTHLEKDQTALLLKKASLNSLVNNRIDNIKVLGELIVCKAPLIKKSRALALLTLDIMLGYSLVFKLKTFYKKHVKNRAQ